MGAPAQEATTSAKKYSSRDSTFGFQDPANLDDGVMWPTAFALTELTATEEARISALVKRAVSGWRTGDSSRSVSRIDADAGASGTGLNSQVA